MPSIPACPVTRTTRNASASTWVRFQVARAAETVAITWAARALIHPAVTSAGVVVRPASERAIIALTASSLPSSPTAWVRHSARCSASERGSCLASRVARVACWNIAIDSGVVGSRPWAA